MIIEAQLPDWRLVQEEGRLGDCDASHAGPSLGLDPREPGAAGMVLFGLSGGLPVCCFQAPSLVTFQGGTLWVVLVQHNLAG